MYEFTCGHLECGSRINASDEDYLMRQVTEHLREAHNVQKGTETLLTYLRDTCVTPAPGKSGR